MSSWAAIGPSRPPKSSRGKGSTPLPSTSSNILALPTVTRDTLVHPYLKIGMGLIDQITIEVSCKAFQHARSGAKINGRHGTSRNIWVRALLGEEVEDTSRHLDAKTEYRKFIGCTLQFAESLEKLKAKEVIRGATLVNQTIWVFAKTA